MNPRNRTFAKDPSGTFSSWAEEGAAPAVTLVSVLIRTLRANIEIEVDLNGEEWGDIRDPENIEDLQLLLQTGGMFHHFSPEQGVDLAKIATGLLQSAPNLTDGERADLQHIIDVVNAP